MHKEIISGGHQIPGDVPSISVTFGPKMWEEDSLTLAVAMIASTNPLGLVFTT